MKKLKLSKVIASTLVVASVLTLNPIGANAQWKQDSNGWWNTEGSSWSVGWRNIDGEWYYFDKNGYMKTGWIQDGGKWYYLDKNGCMKTGWIQDGDKWYYLYSNGAMAKNTTITGYVLGSDGAWIQATQNSLSSLSNVNPDATTISGVTGIKFDDITKIIFYDGRGKLNKPVTVEDKQKVKEFMGNLDGYIINNKEDADPETGWAHAAAFYINDKEVMFITFCKPIIINGSIYTIVKSTLDAGKIDKFLKSIDSSYNIMSDL